MLRTIASCVLTLCLLSTLGSQQTTPQRSQQPVPQAEQTTLTDDDYAICSVALKNVLSNSKVDSIVLLSQTGHGFPPGMAAATEFGEKTKKFVKEVSAEVTKAFDERNNARATIDAGKIAVDVRITTLSAEEARKIVEPVYGWKVFAKQYTPSAEIILLGLPGFNAAKNEALFYIATSCGTLCGEGKLLLLTKKGGQWVVTKEVTMWAS
jgi:hypothetical protein